MVFQGRAALPSARQIGRGPDGARSFERLSPWPGAGRACDRHGPRAPGRDRPPSLFAAARRRYRALARQGQDAVGRASELVRRQDGCRNGGAGGGAEISECAAADRLASDPARNRAGRQGDRNRALRQGRGRAQSFAEARHPLRRRGAVGRTAPALGRRQQSDRACQPVRSGRPQFHEPQFERRHRAQPLVPERLGLSEDLRPQRLLSLRRCGRAAARQCPASRPHFRRDTEGEHAGNAGMAAKPGVRPRHRLLRHERGPALTGKPRHGRRRARCAEMGAHQLAGPSRPRRQAQGGAEESRLPDRARTGLRQADALAPVRHGPDRQ